MAAARYCVFCGQAIATDGSAAERFGDVFCSEAHAEEFAQGVRAARIQAAAARASAADAQGDAPRPVSDWAARLKRSLCWAAPLLLLLALPLLWSGDTLAAAGGSLLSVLVLLACPLGMYFMMRSMMSMGHGRKEADGQRDEREGANR